MKSKRASDRKHHIVYRTTCTITNKFYIGLHSTDDLNDGYVGSGQRLWKSIRKHGKENHVCEILEHLSSREAAAAREKELIEQYLKIDPLCLNLGPGGLGAPDRPPTSADTSRKKSEAMKRLGNDPVWREFKKSAHTNPIARKNNREAQLIAQNRPEVKAKNAASHSKPCTVDGVTIFKSLKDLVASLGQGKSGRHHPNFRYIDDER